MVIDSGLLQAARSALADVATAERHLVHTRGALATAVRNLHAGGGSLREIATTLGLSHQRVHQLVALAGTASPPVLVCSFCGAARHERRRLIAGPRAIGICDACFDPASALLEAWAGAPSEVHRRIEPALRVETARVACSFCGKKAPKHVPAVAVGLSGVAICSECLALCYEIDADPPGDDG